MNWFDEKEENFILDNFLRRFEPIEIAIEMDTDVENVEDFLNDYEIIYPELRYPSRFQSVENMLRDHVGARELGDWVYQRWLERYTYDDISKASGLPMYRIEHIISYQKAINNFDGRGFTHDG